MHSKAHQALLRWPLMVAPWLVGYALTVGSPYAFNNAVFERGLWMIAAVLMTIATVLPTRAWRLRAMFVVLIGAYGRIMVLWVFDTTLSSERLLAGTFVWAMIASFAMIATVFSELYFGLVSRGDGGGVDTGRGRD